MRIGLDVAAQRMPFAEVVDRTRFAEGLGFDGVWGFDHFQPMYGEGPGECFEGYTTMAALAMVTERVRLGLLVTGLTYRPLGLLATEAITIDHPIAKEEGKPKLPSTTHVARLSHCEVENDQTGETRRYSWVEARPVTGRPHQIRRHLKHIAHPIVGDVRYGKAEHNRLFRRRFGLERLAGFPESGFAISEPEFRLGQFAGALLVRLDGGGVLGLDLVQSGRLGGETLGFLGETILLGLESLARLAQLGLGARQVGCERRLRVVDGGGRKAWDGGEGAAGWAPLPAGGSPGLSVVE